MSDQQARTQIPPGKWCANCGLRRRVVVRPSFYLYLLSLGAALLAGIVLRPLLFPARPVTVFEKTIRLQARQIAELEAQRASWVATSEHFYGSLRNDALRLEEGHRVRP